MDTGKVTTLYEKENKVENTKIICSFCYSKFVLTNETKNCGVCHSKDFLLNNSYALLKLQNSNSIYKMYKAKNVKNNLFVTIKERLFGYKVFSEIWKDEIFTSKQICKIEKLARCDMLEILNDIPRSINERYIVFEYSNSKNLYSLNEISLKSTKFNSEQDVLKMMSVLFKELQILQKNHLIHRNINPESILFYECNSTLSFFFTNFGFSSIYNFYKNSTEIEKSFYTSPEINTDEECFASDIFSLSSTISFVINSLKIDVGQKMIALLDDMRNSDYLKRPKIELCLQLLISYNPKFIISSQFDNYSLITNHKSQLFSQSKEN